jgi:uncharacterized phage infection (PIP) family protein YhgE
MADDLVLIDREALLAELKKIFDNQTAQTLLSVLDKVAAQVRASVVTREDFRELRQIVGELAEAQRRTEEQVKELAEAQRKTEERVGSLELAVERLAEAQRKTEERVGSLELAVERLAEAQRKTEERVANLELAVERLAEAQRKTEERMANLELVVERLIEVQQKTLERVGNLELEVKQLNEGVSDLRKQVGGLSDAFGGDIEDIGYIVLHDVLKREFGWEVGVLERSWQTWGKEPEEVNIFGAATDPASPEKKIWIVGEAKHNLTINEVNRFIEQVERARDHLAGEVFPVCFCYRARPEVQEVVKKAGVRLVFSYGKLLKAA